MKVDNKWLRLSVIMMKCVFIIFIGYNKDEGCLSN